MMVAILIERQIQENLLAEKNPDRGSDMGDSVADDDDADDDRGFDSGDCMELLDDEFDNGEAILSDVH